MADQDGGASGGALSDAPEQEIGTSQPDAQPGAPSALPLDPVAQPAATAADEGGAAGMPGSSAEDNTASVSDRTASYNSARSEGGSVATDASAAAHASTDGCRHDRKLAPSVADVALVYNTCSAGIQGDT